MFCGVVKISGAMFYIEVLVAYCAIILFFIVYFKHPIRSLVNSSRQLLCNCLSHFYLTFFFSSCSEWPSPPPFAFCLCKLSSSLLLSNSLILVLDCDSSMNFLNISSSWFSLRWTWYKMIRRQTMSKPNMRLGAMRSKESPRAKCV